MENADSHMCALWIFGAKDDFKFENRAVDIQNSHLTYQNDAKQCSQPLQTTLPLICSEKNDQETVQNGDFPIWAYRGCLAPKTISNLKIEPFAFENPTVISQNCSKQRLGALQTTLALLYPYKTTGKQCKMTIFLCVWALLARTNVLDRVILCSYGRTVHFWGLVHPPRPPGKCFRASWPYFQLLRPSRLEKRLIFRYLGTFY